MDAVQCKIYGGPSAHTGLLPNLLHRSSEIKSGVTSWAAKHLDCQIIFIINIMVINKNVICTLGWDTQGGSVHKNNNMPFLSERNVLFRLVTIPCFFHSTGWKYNAIFFQKYIFLTKWVHSVRPGSCWQLGKEKRGIMQTFGSVNVRTTQLYVCSGEFSSLGECNSKK